MQARFTTRMTTRTFTWLLATCLSTFGTLQTAQAASISAEALSRQTLPAAPERSVAEARAQIDASLARADVAQSLAERGVELSRVQARIAALSDAEAIDLAARIDQAPAGGDILGTLTFLFVLLLVTDILGFTKIFPFTRAIR